MNIKYLESLYTLKSMDEWAGPFCTACVFNNSSQFGKFTFKCKVIQRYEYYNSMGTDTSQEDEMLSLCNHGDKYFEQVCERRKLCIGG